MNHKIDQRDRLLLFVNLCQAAIRLTARETLEQLIQLPPPVFPTEEHTVRAQLCLLLTHIILELRLRVCECGPRGSLTLLELTRPGCSAVCWSLFHDELVRLVRYEAKRNLLVSEETGVCIAERRVATAVKVLARRYAEPNLRLSDVAREAGLSTSHLGRLLSKEVGRGFRTLLTDIRVTQAARLLSQTQLGIKAVAFEVGYKHPSELNRRFKDAYAMTPTAWRERG
jgi:AraC-like DNA-binding protein